MLEPYHQSTCFLNTDIYIYIYIRGGSRLVPLVSGNQSEIWKKERKNYILFFLLLNLILVILFCHRISFFLLRAPIVPAFQPFPMGLISGSVYIYIYIFITSAPTHQNKENFVILYKINSSIYAASHWFPCMAPLVLMEHGNLKQSIGKKTL